MIQRRTEPRTVVLADPRWEGHHPTYFKEFTASLLRLGHRVIALCRRPDELRPAAEATCAELGLDPEEVLHIGALDDPDRAYLLPGRLDHDPLSTASRWRCLRRALQTAERDSGWVGEFVFLPWLDSYLRFLPSKSLPSRALGRPWGGLYFRNHHFGEPIGALRRLAKGDRSLRNRDCRAVGVLDERFAAAMADRSGQPVIPFPDITDETPPGPCGELAKEVARRAGDRKIVGLVGLEKRKGFLTMLRIAEAVAGREDWFFVAAGVYYPESCSVADRRYVEGVARRVDRGDLDNVYLELPGSRVEDGAEFNALLCAFDVIYAAYEDFQGSSNALTKAAVFRRPLVATRGECVGDRVERYRLGLTIPQGDSAAGEDAIRRVLAGVDWDGRPLQPRYREYRSLHDRERLDEVFEQILATL